VGSALTARIIAELEKGRFPWVQPWASSSGVTPLGLPQNASTGRAYSGINILLLWAAAIEQGRPSQRWLTFKQALALGGAVRKGEKGTMIVYADTFIPKAAQEKANASGEEARRVGFLKRFTVSTSNSATGFRLIPTPRHCLAGRRRCRTSKPSYRPPEPTFASAARWRSIRQLMTSSRRRLRRPISNRSTGIAPSCTSWVTGPATSRVSTATFPADTEGRPMPREELVAELCSAFLCAELGVVPTVRHADYLGAWLEVLKSDNRATFQAASLASKAADFVMRRRSAQPANPA
jgi:antirestriction protein ArdC